MAELLTSPRELLAARLRQMLWIELKLAGDVLPQVIEQAHASELQHGFERHLLETEGHVETLREILRELQAPSEPEESPALQGLLKEQERLLEQVSGGPLLDDLALAQSAAAAEHLEIAAYHSLGGLAEALEEDGIAIRLREVMEQEELALELVERSESLLLAEKVESGLL